jgi:hypothetical protein
MGKYCDPKILESTWWAWILADSVKELESLRETGLLWTRSDGDDRLTHRVASIMPYEFVSIDGIIVPKDLDNAIKASFYPSDIILVRKLAANNFHCEIPATETWERLTSMIHKICCGVVLNFRPPSDDVKNELVQEAFTHTLTKIHRGKLKFTPGKAPPFNLLTTAIFRIMYSIKNKEKRDRDHRSRLVEQLMHGAKLPELNSIRVSQSLVGCQH